MKRNEYTALATLFIPLIACASPAETKNQDLEANINQFFDAHGRNGCISRVDWDRMAASAVESVRAEAVNGVEEVDSAYREAYDRFDRNHDGCLTREEYVAVAREEMNTFERSR